MLPVTPSSASSSFSVMYAFPRFFLRLQKEATFHATHTNFRPHLVIQQHISPPYNQLTCTPQKPLQLLPRPVRQVLQSQQAQQWPPHWQWRRVTGQKAALLHPPTYIEEGQEGGRDRRVEGQEGGRGRSVGGEDITGSNDKYYCSFTWWGKSLCSNALQ